MDKRVETIGKETLLPVVRKALGDSSLELASWLREPVYGGFGGAVGGTALFRFKGQTTSLADWSVILKILYQRPQENQSSPYYWKREYEVYRSGMLDDLPSNAFAIPKIYGQADFGDCCWIWMEDIKERKPDWSLADYHRIGIRLGRFNGAYLTGRPLPAGKWLTRDWHAAIMPGLAAGFARLDALLQTPLAQRCLPMDAKAEIEAIWKGRAQFCQALAKLPRTLCHIDAFRRNLLHRENDVVLIDWAVAGPAAVGEDLVALVAVSLYHGHFSQDYAAELDAAVFAGYVQGLRERSWNGDPKLARIGYVCAMTLRGLAGVLQDVHLLNDSDRHEELRQNHGPDIAEVADLFADIRRFRLLKMAREARDLLAN